LYQFVRLTFILTKNLLLYSCSGICERGWYCPPASIDNRQIACGGEDSFCPEGSATPQKVQAGYYSTDSDEPCRPGTFLAPYPDVDVDVSPIATSREEGQCVPCHDGTYKPIASDLECLDCGPKAKSTPDRTTCECFQSATEKRLFELRYNAIEQKCFNVSDGVPPEDFHRPNTQVTKFKESPCEKGYYCHEGTRYKCPGGRFGNKDLETNDNCSGQCEEGYWCGLVSTSPTQNKCGSPNVFCPPGSNAPIYVSEGYYTHEDEPVDLKTSQHLCPEGFYCDNGLRHACEAGTYGASTGQSDKSCDGNCLAGYYCLSASISPHQFPCGNSTVYCPEGSKLPILIEDGYYSATEDEVIVADFYAGPNSTQQIQCKVDACLRKIVGIIPYSKTSVSITCCFRCSSPMRKRILLQWWREGMCMVSKRVFYIILYLKT